MRVKTNPKYSLATGSVADYAYLNTYAPCYLYIQYCKTWAKTFGVQWKLNCYEKRGKREKM